MFIGISSQPVSEYWDLVWKIFFVKKGRGVSLDAHFPWSSRINSDVWYVFARHNECLVGGLAVREQICELGAFGVIGLVCVSDSMRGQGIASNLIRAALEHAAVRKLGALTLWTSQPYIYSGQGFVMHDAGLFGRVTQCAKNSIKTSREAYTTVVWPSDESSHRGIPPFAASAQSIVSIDGLSEVIVVEDRNGPIVAEWHGTNESVETLFRIELPLGFRLNARYEDTLPKVMRAAGWDIDLAAAQLQMWRIIDSDETSAEWDSSSRLRLLDRI